MSTSKVKICIVGMLLVAGITLLLWQRSRLQDAQSELAQLRAKETELAGLQTELERLRKVEADQAELERLRQWQEKTQPELVRLRGLAGVARRANVETAELRSQLAQQASEAATTNLLASAMGDAMRLALNQQSEGRLSRMTASLRLTPEQVQAVREILKKQAQAMSAGMQQAFSGKLNKDELARLGKDAGNTDDQIKALLTPEQKAAYQNYQQEESAHNASLAANAELLQMQSTLGLTSDQQDRAFAALYEVNYSQLTGNAKPDTTNQAAAIQWVLDQKTKALESVLTAPQLDSYRQQQALQSKLMNDVLKKMEGVGGTK